MEMALDVVEFLKLESAVKDKGQRVEVDVVVPAEQVALAINEFYLLMAKIRGLACESAEIAKQCLEEVVDEEDLLDARRDFALNRFTTAAVSRIDVDTVLAPGVHSEEYPSTTEDFAFTINLVPRPELSLSSIDPVEVNQSIVNVEEADIDAQVAYTAQQFKSLQKVDRKVLKEGDFAVADVDLLCNGELRKDLSGMRRVVEVRPGLLPDGFIEALLGMEVGEIKKMSFNVPTNSENDTFDHYSADVHLWEIREEIIPIINDEWVMQNLPQFENVEGFRAYIRKDLEEQKAKVEKQDLVYQVRSALEKRLVGSIPDEMYQTAKDSLMLSTIEKIESQGSSLDQYCEEHNLEKEAFNMNVFMQASEFLRQNLALDALADAKGFAETEEDVQKAKKALPSAISALSDEKFAERGFRKSLGEQIRRDKALQWLLETAVINPSNPA